MCQTCRGQTPGCEEQIEAKIVELGRRQLLDHGAAGACRFGQFARNLRRLVSSAVYRYVSSRDELLTLLLVDALTRTWLILRDRVDDTVADRE